MSTTVNLDRAGFAIMSSELGMEEFNDHTSGSVFLTNNDHGYKYLLAKFRLSGNDKYREIISSQVLLSGSSGHSIGYGLLGYQMLNKSFLPETVTYKSFGSGGFGESSSIKFPTETKIVLPASRTKYLIQYGIGFHSDNYGQITLSTVVNANITLSDDYVYQKIKSVSPTGNVTLSRQQPNVFSVETQPNASYYIELPAISSVKFRYRGKSAESYKEVDNGTALSYEMPGNLMPTGEMEFQWAVTDILGHTEISAWTTVKTENKVLISTSPTGNVFVNRFKDAFFGYTAAPGVVVKTFRYRKSGETEWVEKAVNDTQKGYTLSAGTITEGAQFEYGWLSTDRYNAQWSDDGYKFYTTDAISSCQIVEPMRTIVDSDKKTIFRWRHIISTGSDQTKAELQRSRNGSTWLGIGTVEGKETELEFAEKTFTSGTWYWRARTYNADGVAGEWSAAAQFVAVGSPTTPAITVLDYSPRPEIRWETSEQTAYEIGLDGVNETIYGPDKTWKSRAYLADGEHIITVRSQNQYGRWSEPGEAIINVLNQTGPGIVLSASGKTLTWETVGAYDRFQVYRDLKLIAETQERVYTDQVANGAATYQVRGCYDISDNYGLSNAVETEIQREYHEIYNLETGVSLTIQHCGLRNQPVSRSSTRDIKMVHVPGYENPVVERGEYRDVNLNGAAVFFEREEAEAFEAMSGCLVCFITPSGTNYTGILNSVETTPKGIRTDCTFKLTKADGEAVEHTVSLPAFDIDVETGSLIMTASDSYTGPEFTINRLGDLEVRQ